MSTWLIIVMSCEVHPGQREKIMAAHLLQRSFRETAFCRHWLAQPPTLPQLRPIRSTSTRGTHLQFSFDLEKDDTESL